MTRVMTPDELLSGYFGIDVSGNGIDGLIDIQKRINPVLITKNKATEFVYVMDILIPTWKEEKELEAGAQGGRYEIVGVFDDEDEDSGEMCICCQQNLHNLCYVKHPSLPFALQIGNVCLLKLDPEIKGKIKDAKKAIKRKRMEEELRRQQAIERKRMEEELRRQREEIERKRIEEERERVRVLTEFRMRMAEDYRPCQHRGCLGWISKKEPGWKIRCLNCWIKMKNQNQNQT